MIFSSSAQLFWSGFFYFRFLHAFLFPTTFLPFSSLVISFFPFSFLPSFLFSFSSRAFESQKDRGETLQCTILAWIGSGCEELSTRLAARCVKGGCERLGQRCVGQRKKGEKWRAFDQMEHVTLLTKRISSLYQKKWFRYEIMLRKILLPFSKLKITHLALIITCIDFPSVMNFN